MELLLTLPIPPSINKLYRNAKAHVRYMTQEGKAWKEEAQFQSSLDVMHQRWSRTAEKVVMELKIYWPDKRRRDCDNVLKVLQDALTGIVWKDDCNTLPRVMDFDIDRKNPRVELKIYLMEG